MQSHDINTASLNKEEIEKMYRDFISNKSFPCIGAKASQTKNQSWCLVTGNMACPANDLEILEFIYKFTDEFRKSTNGFYSATIVFDGPGEITETMFETFLWQRLQAISDLDAQRYPYDQRVSRDPFSGEFSFSLKEEAFYIIGMHAASSRPARRFPYPALVFNPHNQFEKLKQGTKYENMQRIIRKNDLALSGSINPMLKDHGVSSEILQYSGKNYITPPECPLHIKHGNK